MVVGHQDKFVIVQTHHRLVDEDLSKLVVDQTHHRLVEQIQDKFGIFGITIVDIVGAMVVDLTIVAHHCKFDEVMNKLNQYKSESF